MASYNYPPFATTPYTKGQGTSQSAKSAVQGRDRATLARSRQRRHEGVYLAGPAQLANLAATAADEGASVLDQIRVVRTMLMSQLAATTEAGDARGAAIVAGQLVGVPEKIGKVTGEIATIAQDTINIQNSVAIVNSPQFAKVRQPLRPLAPHGAARAAVVAALQSSTLRLLTEVGRPW